MGAYTMPQETREFASVAVSASFPELDYEFGGWRPAPREEYAPERFKSYSGACSCSAAISESERCRHPGTQATAPTVKETVTGKEVPGEIR